jgi:hypothetical protein
MNTILRSVNKFIFLILILFSNFILAQNLTQESPSIIDSIEAQSSPLNNKSFIYGSADLKGSIALILMPNEFVQSLLPDGLVLSPEPDFPKGFHPITILWGKHKNLRSNIFRWSFPLKSRYLETLVTVTHVKKVDYEKSKTSEKKYSYTPKILVNSRLAIFLGQFYGLNKFYSNIELSEDSFIAKDKKSSEIALHATSRKVANINVEQLQDHWQKVQKGFELPLITIVNGKFVCADFNWNIESAKIEPIDVQLELGSHFLGPESAGIYQIQGLDLNQFGAFNIKTHWELSWVHSCH